MTDQLTVLVLGASRGLGLGLAHEWLIRGWRVIATIRTPSKELDELAASHPEALEIQTVDVSQACSVRNLRRRLDGQRLDVLFINAGIALANEKTPAQVDEKDFVDMMLVNALSPVRAAEILGDLVPAGGTIAVMSSEFGSISNTNGAGSLYSSSKAALSMLMKGYAVQNQHNRHAILLVAPGWVRTDMGGSNATLLVEDSVPLVVDTIEANRGILGLRYVDRFNAPIPW